MKSIVIAHVRKSDGNIQTLEEHLRETGVLAESFCQVLGLGWVGRLLGLVHDIGKYSSEFDEYIRGMTGLAGEAGLRNALPKKGKIDHSTSGAQLIWKEISRRTGSVTVMVQILALSVMSHHSRTGLLDFLALDGTTPFKRRLNRSEGSTHLNEVLKKMDQSIWEEIRQLLADDNRIDECKSIKARIDATSLDTKKESFKKDACAQWFDVRAFGQIFPFKGKASGDGVSIPVRGPVSVQPAFSLEPVSVSSTQITKSTNLEDSAGGKRGSDTMGMKHRVDKGLYVFKGSINAQLASDETGTGFSDEDADKIKSVLTTLFENDASSARSDGTMEVKKVIWWNHSCPSGDYSSAKVHRSLTVKPDGSYALSNLEGLIPEELDGF